MKRLVIGGAAAALIVGGAGMSFAGNGPGPHGPNNWGQCNAYAHNGGGNSHNAKPFAALATTAGDYNQDGTTNEQDVYDWCAANGQKPGGK
jgi:hypothetical protein